MVTAPEIIIRSACRDDVPTIFELVCELARYEKLEHEVVAQPQMLEQWLFGEHPAAEVLIAELDGNSAGFALFFTSFSTFLGRPGIYLEDLFVREPLRGIGVGGALLHRLAVLADERGYGRVEWAVLNWNEPAIGFYRAIGAQAQDEWTTYRLTGAALSDYAAGEKIKTI